MAADDLDTPLGMDRRPPRRRVKIAPLLAGMVFASLAAVVGWIALVDDPLGGEPRAVAVIERHRPSPPEAKPARQTASVPDAATPVPVEAKPGAAGPLIIKVPQNGSSVGSAVSGAPRIDPGLIETSRHGPLPKIGADGTRPSDVYATTTVAEAEDRRPKIAILIGGLGISREATAQVFERLPRSITLGFAPYGDNLDQWVATARKNAQEVMLQVPMEPFDYPNNDPGPHTLLTSLPAEANLDRLAWVMSRVEGYYGLTNFMGAKFTSWEEALSPVLTEAGRRGLVFLDTGASPTSLVARLGAGAGLPTARAEIVIDATPSAEAIDAALVRLEDEARREGAVIGVASALPVTIARLEQWAGQLTSKGIALVPVSAVVKRAGSS